MATASLVFTVLGVWAIRSVKKTATSSYLYFRSTGFYCHALFMDGVPGYFTAIGDPGSQAAIRTTGGQVVTLWANSTCSAKVYFVQ